MRRRLAATLACVAAAAGCACLAEGAWIRVRAVAAQLLLERAWSETLARQRPVAPWPGAATRPGARLLAPGHDIALVVLGDASPGALALGPGPVAGSAPPGAPGNTVLAGHRDTHFRFLEHVAPGDTLLLVSPDGIRHAYRVRRTEVFDGHTALLEPTERPALTLVTCYPFDAIGPAPLRYAVRAESTSGERRPPLGSSRRSIDPR